MLKKIFLLIVFCAMAAVYNAWAQFIDLSGNNPAIKEYVEASPENWNRPIMYVFYSNRYCYQCVKAMDMIYNIYEENYADTMSLFEINYTLDDEYQFRLDYNLSQPISIVIVRIRDGISQGYYKIDNPQEWTDDPFYFKQNIITQINNFLLQ